MQYFKFAKLTLSVMHHDWESFSKRIVQNERVGIVDHLSSNQPESSDTIWFCFCVAMKNYVLCTYFLKHPTNLCTFFNRSFCHTFVHVYLLLKIAFAKLPQGVQTALDGRHLASAGTNAFASGSFTGGPFERICMVHCSLFHVFLPCCLFLTNYSLIYFRLFFEGCHLFLLSLSVVSYCAL